MTGIIAAFLASLLFLGPLGWRVWLDKKRDEADAIKADIRAAVTHRLVTFYLPPIWGWFAMHWLTKRGYV